MFLKNPFSIGEAGKNPVIDVPNIANVVKQINIEPFNPSDPMVNMTIKNDKPSVRSLGVIIPPEN